MDDDTDAVRLRIGVFGGAFVTGSPAIELMAGELGRSVARRGHIVVTGATSGLPYIVGKAAIDEGGTTLGISPARDPN